MIGYLFWTTSDNWEWADGYGPKFGLVAVDRANNLARKPRPSYYLFSKVIILFKIGLKCSLVGRRNIIFTAVEVAWKMLGKCS